MKHFVFANKENGYWEVRKSRTDEVVFSSLDIDECFEKMHELEDPGK